MSLLNSSNWQPRSSKKSSGTRPRPRYRPSLESLESRVVLSTTINWSGGGDGTTWSQNANWSGNVVPGASNDAMISVASNVTITLPSGGISVTSLTQTGGTLVMPSGTITTTGATGLTLNNATFTQNGGTLPGPATVNSGTFNESGGTVSGTVTVNSGTFNQNSGTITGAATVNSGTFYDNGGTIPGTATVFNSTLNLSASAGMANFVAEETSTVTGTITANQTIQVEGLSAGSANLTIAQGVSNLGTILLQSAAGNSDPSNLIVAAGSTFTNTGTVTDNSPTFIGNIAGSFINQGNLTVVAGSTLDVGSSGLTFTQQSGMLIGNGNFICDAGTLLITGGTVKYSIIADNGAMIDLASSITSMTTVFAQGATTLVSNDSTMGTVQVEGLSSGSANLTIAQGANNVGTILLDSAAGNSDPSNVIVAAGTTFTNVGTVTDNSPTFIGNIAGSFINAGTLTVDSGSTLDVGSANLTFTQQSGTLTAVGTGNFICDTGTLLITGGTVAGSIIADNVAMIDIASSITAATLVYAQGASVTLISNDSTMGTIQVEGLSSGVANLTIDAGAHNIGTILLQSAAGNSDPSDITVAAGSTFTNTGTVTDNSPTFIGNVAGNFINTGIFMVDSGSTLDVGSSGLTFTQQSGTLTANGNFVCDTGTLLVTGGTITGSIIADNVAMIDIASSITSAVTVYAQGASVTLITDDSAIGTVQVEGLSSGVANLTIDAGANNIGTILLQSAAGNSDPSDITVAAGTNFTNVGTLTDNSPTFIGNVAGNFINAGTLTVDSGSTLDVGSANLTFTQQSGTLTAVGTGNFICDAGTLLITGGAVTGSIIADNGAMIDLASSINSTTLVYAQGATTLFSNDSAMATVQVEGLSSGSANLTIAQGANNVGTILLQSAAGNSDPSNVIVAAGSTFSNVGTLTDNSPTFTSTLAGNFVNQGTININGATLALATGATLVNATTGQINASGTLNTSAGSFTNKGTLSIGTTTTASTLTITGGYTQMSTGTLNFKLGGTAAGTLFDQLNISGQAALDGTLNVSLLNNFVPAFGNAFKVLTFGSVAGTFATYTGTTLPNGLILQPNQTSTSLTLTTVNPPMADLSVTVVAQPTQVTIGGNVTYVVTVTNNGPNAASAVILTDSLPSGATVGLITPSTGTDQISNGVVTASFGNLASGTFDTLTIVVTPTSTGSFVDSATAGSSTADPTSSNNTGSATATVVPITADLLVTVSAQPTQVTLGGNLTYTVTVTNNGPNTASMVSLADTLPSAATVVSVTPSTGSDQVTGGVANVTFGDLASGASDTLTIVVTPTATGSFVDSANAISPTYDPNSSNNTASATATVVSLTADLSVSAVAQPGQLTIGGNLTYIVIVTNSGPNAASAVVLTDTLPSGATIVSVVPSTGTDQVSNGVATASLGNLASGTSATLTIVVTPTGTGSFVNSATAISPTYDPTLTNNSASATATVVPIMADLSVTVAAQPAQVILGGNATYLVTVTNNGPNTAPGAVLTDTLPSGATIVSSTAGAGSLSTNGSFETLTIGSLAFGSSVTLTIVVTPAATGLFVDSASVATISSVDPVSSNNTASATATVVPPPSADLSVAITGPPAVAGSTKFSFVATVTNHGPNPAMASTLVETFTLPQGAMVYSVSASQGSASIASNVVTANFGMIASGATSVLTVVIATTVGGTFADSATVQSTTADPTPGNNQATATVPVTALDAIAVGTSTTAATFNQPVTLTATVSGPAGFAGPTGMVSFLEGTTVLGSATLNASGVASLAVTSLPLGTQPITATYSGNASYLAVTGSSTPIYVGDGVKADFDGDGKVDLAVFGKDPVTGRYDYRIVDSTTGKTVIYDNNGFGYGNAQSIPVVGDFFGDGRSSYALWTPNASGGMTFTAVSPLTYKSISINFGSATDLPLVADVDGDGKDDFGVYGYQAGLGYRFDFVLSSDNFSITAQDIFNNNGFGYGGATSIPIVADFDGSGKAGFGLFNPLASGSTFTYVNPSINVSIARTIGAATDVPTAVDFDGDGKADLALYGPDPSVHGHYRYLILTSSSGYSTAQAVKFDNNGYGYGNATSIPVMADYEGTGKADFGLFTADGTGGNEFVYLTGQTGAGVFVDFATATDIPLTAPEYLIAKKVRGS